MFGGKPTCYKILVFCVLLGQSLSLLQEWAARGLVMVAPLRFRCARRLKTHGFG